MWKYFEFEVNGENRLYRAKMGKGGQADPVAGLIADYKHADHGWRRVNSLNKREILYKELRQYLSANTLNKSGFLGLIHEMTGNV